MIENIAVSSSLLRSSVDYSGDHTLEYLKEVFSPEVGVEDGTLKETARLVLDAF